MKTKIKFYLDILKESFVKWKDSDAMKDSSSIAYTALFSIPGLLIIIIWLAGNLFGEESVSGEVTKQLQGMVGRESAQSIQDILANSLVDKNDIFMKTVGVLSLVFGATTLFYQLQQCLNELWGIKSKPEKAWLKFIVNRLLSLSVIVVIGFLLMVSMLLSTFIGYFDFWINEKFGLEILHLVSVLNMCFGFGISFCIFAAIFKILPDLKIRWRSVFVGAFFTTILFLLGKFLMSYYFNTMKPASAFGTAGSVILIMLWVNYSCMLLLFGVTFTKVYNDAKGYEVIPNDHAVIVDED